MSYLNVVSLSDAKVYLRIDDTLNETDAEITVMINASCRYVENITNHILYARNKVYYVNSTCFRLHDYPVNEIIEPTPIEIIERGLSTIYNFNSTIKTLTANVGYSDPLDVPSDLRQVILELVKLMYYSQESKESFENAMPYWCKAILESNRRFII